MSAADVVEITVKPMAPASKSKLSLIFPSFSIDSHFPECFPPSCAEPRKAGSWVAVPHLDIFELWVKAFLAPVTNQCDDRARLDIDVAVTDICLMPGSGSRLLPPTVTAVECERTADSVC